MRKKRILSEDHKRKIGEALKGKKKIFSDQAIENIRIAAAKRKGVPVGPCSKETKERIRNATIGKPKIFAKPHPNWFKKGGVPQKPFVKGNVPWNKGKPVSEKMRLHLSSLRIGKKLTPESIEKIRKSLTKNWDEYVKYDRNCAASRRWSKEVRSRDQFMCQHCKSTDKRLHAHHIKSWKDNELLRFDISNGITLCISCHSNEHKDDPSRIFLSKWRKGKKMNDNHRMNLSNSLKGRIPWNKGLKTII